MKKLDVEKRKTLYASRIIKEKYLEDSMRRESSSN